MPRRGARRRLDAEGPGLWEDDGGIAAVVKLRGVQRERRFAFAKHRTRDRALAAAKSWQRRARAALELEVEDPQDQRTDAGPTLAEDVARYLELLPVKSNYRRDTDTLLGHWVRVLGARARATLTAADLHQQLLAWHAEGVAAQTVNHRRRALGVLYRVLDGTRRHVVADVPKLPTGKRAPRGLPWPLVRRILVALPDRSRPTKGDPRGVVSKTKARLWVMARTGWPHMVIERLKPGDLHLDATPPWVQVRPRRKGAGTAGRALPVTPAAARALRRFAAAGAWGAFSRGSMHASFTRAVAAARARWEAQEARHAKRRRRAPRPWPVPDDVHPYDVRHSWVTWAYARTRDLRAVQEVALHASLTTTAHYAEAAVSETAAATIAALSGPPAGTQAGTRRKFSRTGAKSRL